MVNVDIIKRERNTKTYAAGEIIFAEGDTDNDCMYVVAQGQVEIENSRKFLELIEPGGFFGEMALVNDKPRSATARAKTDCTVIEVNQGDFYFLVQHSPHFAIQVMQVLSERVRRNTES
jgi:CRP-like cAMP-binding protein